MFGVEQISYKNALFNPHVHTIQDVLLASSIQYMYCVFKINSGILIPVLPVSENWTN